MCSPWTGSNEVGLRGLRGFWGSAGKAPAEVTTYYHIPWFYQGFDDETDAIDHA